MGWLQPSPTLGSFTPEEGFKHYLQARLALLPEDLQASAKRRLERTRYHEAHVFNPEFDYRANLIEDRVIDFEIPAFLKQTFFEHYAMAHELEHLIQDWFYGTSDVFRDFNHAQFQESAIQNATDILRFYQEVGAILAEYRYLRLIDPKAIEREVRRLQGPIDAFIAQDPEKRSELKRLLQDLFENAQAARKLTAQEYVHRIWGNGRYMPCQFGVQREGERSFDLTLEKLWDSAFFGKLAETCSAQLEPELQDYYRILKWQREGLSSEEIEKRIAEPRVKP